MMRRALPWLLLGCAAACGGEAPPPAPPPPRPPPLASMTATTTPPAPTPPPVLAPLDVDPVAVGLARTDAGSGGSGDDTRAREGIVRLCDESLARARATLDDVRALDGKADAELTWATTLGKIDQARVAIRNAGDFPALMAVAHPDEGVREHAKQCEPKVDHLETDIWLDATLARVVKRYAAKNEALTPPQARLLEHTLRDFRRNGLDLDPKGQARLRAINEELTQLGQDFDANLASAHLSIEVTPRDLDGLPREWLASHPPDASGKVHVSTDYPDYFPVLTY
ncbi:MAG TPA: oligopeptidase A, partial [Labilithrix sp.]